MLRIEEIKGHEEVEAVKRLKNNLGLTQREAEVLLWIAREKQTAKLAIF
ncbi:hypothetical protein LNP25_00125 [Klebsiella variicola subsp. variicola]|nr:hypothetical protein [Klebsiella variicola subsp. variicola]